MSLAHSVTNKDPVSNKIESKRQYLRLSSDLHTDTVTLYTHPSDTHIPCTHTHTQRFKNILGDENRKLEIAEMRLL